MLRYSRVVVPRKLVASVDNWVINELHGEKICEMVHFLSRKREIVYGFKDQDDEFEFIHRVKNFKNVHLIP